MPASLASVPATRTDPIIDDQMGSTGIRAPVVSTQWLYPYHIRIGCGHASDRHVTAPRLLLMALLLSTILRTVRATLFGCGVALWLVVQGHPIAAGAVMGVAILLDGASLWQRRSPLSSTEDPSLTKDDGTPFNVPLAQALDHLPGVFYVIGPAGRLIRWNARFESVSGYSADDLRGSLAFRFFEGEDRRRIAAAVLRVYAVGDARVEAEFITKTADALPMLFSGSRIVIDGDPHLVGMGIDVADRIAAEEALRRREMEYRMLAENVIDVVSHHTADTTRLYVSPSIEDLVGFTPEELIGRRAYEDIHPDDQGEVQRSLQKSLEHDPVARAEYRMRCKDGSWVWVETVGRYVDTGLGDREIIATTRDISNQKALEEQLREALSQAESAREEAERAERLKSLFLANMSHEIRTPLTSIIGFSEVLADEVPEPYSGMAEMVGKSGQRLIDTIGSVLALSKLEAGRWSGDFEPVNLGDEVCTTIDLMSPQSAERRARRAGLRPSRPLGPAAHHRQPAQQRHQVQPGRMPRAGARSRRAQLRPGCAGGRRRRTGHSEEPARGTLQPVLARQLRTRQPHRRRPGPIHHPPPRRPHGRPHRGGL